jgi:hypothetical protein
MCLIPYRLQKLTSPISNLPQLSVAGAPSNPGPSPKTHPEPRQTPQTAAIPHT